MRCVRCDTESQGRYCAGCGAPMEGASCGACEAALPPGARYCTACGEAVRREPGAVLPWTIAGAAVVALLVVLLFPVLDGDPQPGRTSGMPVAPPGAAGGGFGAPGPAGGGQGLAPLTGTMREQADRLFNRVMEAESRGDAQEVAFFLPMAVSAYEAAGELDADGLYHLSILHAAGGRPDASRAAAERVLAEEPDHLLALGAALQAARQAGDGSGARALAERLLAAYGAGVADPRPEYHHHEPMLAEYRDEARRLLGR